MTRSGNAKLGVETTTKCDRTARLGTNHRYVSCWHQRRTARPDARMLGSRQLGGPETGSSSEAVTSAILSTVLGLVSHPAIEQRLNRSSRYDPIATTVRNACTLCRGDKRMLSSYDKRAVCATSYSLRRHAEKNLVNCIVEAGGPPDDKYIEEARQPSRLDTGHLRPTGNGARSRLAMLSSALLP